MTTLYASSVVQCYDPERLYLLQSKDNNEVSVKNFMLKQHQIDGLRFLFKEFNKKSPGAIVTFPPLCGKSTTIAVFLNAVSSVLKNPVLIFCKDDDDVNYWKQILLQWSSYDEDDIAVESSNPFIKGKKVFLKKYENLSSYPRRRWGVFVMKENVFSKELFKLAIEADFKICITSTDVKKDLSLLKNIYSWLYPKRKVNLDEFIAKENSPKEKFLKSVQLDVILEDVAIRRYHNLKPFQASKKQVLSQNNDFEEISTPLIESNTKKLKECNNFNETLEVEESGHSYNIVKDDQNEIGNLDRSLLKEKSAESIQFSSNSKLDVSKNQELNEQHSMQQQLIEPMGLDNVEADKKEEPNNVTEYVGCEVRQSTVNVQDDETIVLKLESEEENVSMEETNITNMLSNKRKSDVSDKDLDNKILEVDDLNNVEVDQKEDANNVNKSVESEAHQTTVDTQNDKTIVLKLEPDEDVSMEEANTTDMLSSKRKSDVSDKDLDSKILDVEERALKKFKGSLLDSIF